MNAAVPLSPSRDEPASPDWRRSTPVAVVRAFDQRDAARFGRSIRKLPLFAAVQRSADRHTVHPYGQVLWSQHAFPDTDRSRAWAALLSNDVPAAKASRKHRARRAAAVADILRQSAGRASHSGFELLAGMAILLHETRLPDDLFLQMWTGLQDWAQSQLQTPPKLAGRLAADQRILLLGELPWTFGSVFACLRGARRAAASGAAHLRDELEQICDVDGVPHASLLARLPLCLAPFTRASTLADLTEIDWRDRTAAGRYRRFVLRTMPLLQPDGRTALSNGVVHKAASLLHAATQSAGLKKSHHASLLAASLATTTPDRRERHRTSLAPRLKRKHRPSVQSDVAQLACLRNNWGVGADACIITFDCATPRIDLAAFGIPVLSGEWGCSTRLNERERSASAGRWKCVCWYAGSTADYVELQRTDADGGRLLRQAFLSRDDHFLILSDAVHAAGAECIDHTVTLPLQCNATAQQDALTREWALERGPLTLRVIPLGLPQQVIDRADGRLTIDSSAVTLQQSSNGPHLGCPLLLDWSPVRRKSPAQWKQLTVAENGRILMPSESLGVRWRIGDAQWLYYHLLEPGQTARTVLGHHTFHETVIAEVDSSGEVNQLVEVESEPGV
jgi:hypothetical protein